MAEVRASVAVACCVSSTGRHRSARASSAEQQRIEAARERTRQFDAIAEQFIQRHVASARTARAIELRIRRELITRWGDRPIDKITRTDVANMVVEDNSQAWPPRGGAADLRLCTSASRWAAARGLLKYAPTDYLNIKDLVGAKRARQRLLRDEELALVWRAAAQAPYPDGPYVKLLLLLGVRRSELGQAVWSEIDLDRAL